MKTITSLNFIRLLIISVFLLLYTLVFMTYSYHKEERIKDSIAKQSEHLQSNYNISTNRFKIISDNFYNILLYDADVLELLYSAKNSKNKRQRALIRKKLYERILPHYNYLTKLGVNIIQFSFENNKSFLRLHKPSKFGDDLSSIRYSFAYVNSTKKPIRGLEEGKISHAFRNVFPLYYANEYISSVDISFSSNEMQKNMNNLYGTDTHFILNKSVFKTNIYKAQKQVKYIQSIEHDDFLFAFNNNNKKISSDKLTVTKELKQEIAKNIQKDIPFSVYQNMSDYTYIISFLPIKDIKNKKTIAYLVSYSKDTALYSDLHEHIIINTTAFLLLLLLSIIVYFNIKQRLYLQIEVDEKTKDLKEQKIELEKLLNSFDKNVIFSKTDLKGKITHVSEAFCKISGYKAEELIGKPHNIVRHPDMPQEVFKDLWSTIKSGSKWSGEVKNRKKYGGFYWVFSDIEPEYNHKGELIGYYAVRHNITSKKNVEALSKELENINANLEQEVTDRVNDIIALDKEIIDTQKEVVFTMGAIAENRSQETGNHVKRVAEYSKLLALYYGLSEEEAEMLKQASPMHDIGKVAIPDAILNKPGRFDEDERKIMDTHSELGYNMLKHSTRPLLKMAATVAYEHHEKWDGSGYPNNLKGEDIHIYGRITALADVFDALGSDRVYKKSWELERILKLFKEQRAKHFDPKLIDIFFDNLDEFLAIRDRFVD